MYSISDLERISDVKAHTIRIWEKRYALFNPTRTKGNHRLYGDGDLIRLLNITRMVKAGHRVSVVSKWNEVEMSEQIAVLEGNIDSGLSDNEFYVEEILASALSYNEEAFLKVFDRIDKKYDFAEVWSNYLCPVLLRIGELWISKKMSPAQEHFLSYLIERKIFSKVDQLPQVPTKTTTFLLFLPEGEIHELGLQFSHYCIKKAGFKVVYLGANVPIKNVDKYLIDYKPDVILTYINGIRLSKNFKTFLSKSDQFACDVLLSGRLNTLDHTELEGNKNVFVINTIEEIKSYLSQLT